MPGEFERRIRKNWVVGAVVAGVFLLIGNTFMAASIGVGTIVWNVILYGIARWVGSSKGE